MQQLNSLYRGDSSETLGQIMGGQYAPQNMLGGFTSNLAITGVQGAGATMRTAMQLYSQENMERRRLAEQKRQFGLTNELAQRQQYEAELNGESTRGYNAGMLANSNRTTDWTTGGQTDAEAEGAMTSMMSELDLAISRLDPNDPNYGAQKSALEARKLSISEQMKGAKGRRGTGAGVAGVIKNEMSPTLGRDGKPVAGSITSTASTITTAASKPRFPAPAPAPAPVRTFTNDVNVVPNGTTYTTASGQTYTAGQTVPNPGAAPAPAPAPDPEPTPAPTPAPASADPTTYQLPSSLTRVFRAGSWLNPNPQFSPRVAEPQAAPGSNYVIRNVIR